MNRKKVTFLYDEKYLKKLESENAELKAKERKYFLDRIEAVESLPINKWKKKFPDFYSWLLQEGFVYKEEFDQGQCKSEIENLHSENAELKKELNEVGRKWLNDFSRQDTLITELKARWEKLEEIEHEHRTIEGKQWISLGLLKRRMQELESGFMKPEDCPKHLYTDKEGKRIDYCIKCKTPKPDSEEKGMK